jgi:hypothetical protein
MLRWIRDRWLAVNPDGIAPILPRAVFCAMRFNSRLIKNPRDQLKPVNKNEI